MLGDSERVYANSIWLFSSDYADRCISFFDCLAAHTPLEASRQVLEILAFRHHSFRVCADEHGVLWALRYCPGFVRFVDDTCTRPIASFCWFCLWGFAVARGFVGHLFRMELLCGKEMPGQIANKSAPR